MSSVWGTGLRKIVVTVLGWILLLLGLAALALPGPGLLMLLAGMVLLSQQYTWAEQRVEPVKRQAFATAAAGVQTVPRIAVSVLGALVLAAVGVFWGLDPQIPQVWRIGPELPFGGWGTGVSLIVSAVVALGLLVWSYQRFSDTDPETAEHEASASVESPG